MVLFSNALYGWLEALYIGYPGLQCQSLQKAGRPLRRASQFGVNLLSNAARRDSSALFRPGNAREEGAGGALGGGELWEAGRQLLQPQW